MTNGSGWVGGVGLALGLLLGYIVGAGSAPPANPAERELNANLWMQTSAEYHALCLQTYRHARECLEKRLANPPAGDKPFAIILDLDETVLDNLRYQGWLYDNATTFHDDTWALWEQNHANDVGLVPGAREFILDVEARQNPAVKVFYISNRLKKYEKGTLKALEALKLATPDIEQRLLLRGNGSDKESRRKQVEADHRVLLLIGDNLGDLSSVFAPEKVPPDNLEAQTNAITARRKKVDQFAQRFGHDWIVLPNPVYGDWPKPLGAEPSRHLRTTKLRKP